MGKQYKNECRVCPDIDVFEVASLPDNAARTDFKLLTAQVFERSI